MARKKADKDKPTLDNTPNKISGFLKNETTHFVIGLICIILAVYMLLAFTSFFFTGAADQSIIYNQEKGELLQTTNHIKNYAGARGAILAETLINQCFGIASYFIILFLAAVGMKLMKAYKVRVWKWFMTCAILLIWFSITLGFAFDGLIPDSFIYPGGLHGYNVSRWFISQIGVPGLLLLLLTTAILLFIYISKETINIIRKIVHPQFSSTKSAFDDDNEVNHFSDSEDIETEDPKPIHVNFELDNEKATNEEEDNSPIDPIINDQSGINNDLNEKSSDISFSMPHLAHQNGEAVIKKSVDSDGDVDDEELSFTVESQNNDDDKEYNGPVLSPYNPKLDLENYKYPTIDLLKSYDDQGPNIDMEEQNANKDRIINVLRSFGIEISSIKASVGPTITLYEITPAEGVRISKIRNLEDDIALSLSALGIRIIAPIPGKGTIGIEVPNANPKIVSMRSIINSKKFQETTYDLPVALGKTITNDVFMVDLTKAPHMLVAGATGQGKSVGLNAIVTSLLYKKHPAELKFVIIDPKKVEFSVYAPIERHFLAKLPDGDDAIITDVTKVVQTLNSLCSEMDTRYDLLRKAGCRNIKEYNAKFISRKLNPEKGHRFMPYIVIIIDEFGDLIMTAGKEIELPICRIAQLARAIGIHAIIATQRPTTNIITGTIKANFPARIAFRVAAMMDSRTILDRSGAQQLIGKGDMLYLQGNDPVRVQCAFVDTPEVENITNYISKQQGYTSAFMLPEYVGEESESTLGDIDMNRLDPMFEDAARLIVIHQQGSTSLIQRKFSIGYNRAGRIMDQLERAGIVGPTQGSKAREVLCVDETDLQMRLSNLQQ